MIPRLLLLAALVAAPLRAAASAPQAPRPPAPLLVADVRLSGDPEAQRVSIVVRDGRIERILPAGTPPPPGLRRIEGDGALCLPAFVDAFHRGGFDTPEPEPDRDAGLDESANVALGMREANRKGVQPAFRAVDVLAHEEPALEALRRHGFGVVHAAPGGELLAGRTALVTTGSGALRGRVLRAVVGQSAGLSSSGRGYPRTLMGSLAQLRQFFLDAGRHERRLARPEVGRRPPWDADLDAGARMLAGEERLWASADDREDAERWLQLADRFGLELVLVGGRDAWRMADRLKSAEVPVVLTLDWGEEPKDPEAEQSTEDEPPSETEDPDPESDERPGPEESPGDAPAPEGDPGTEPESDEPPAESGDKSDADEQSSPAEQESQGETPAQESEPPTSDAPEDGGSEGDAAEDWIYEEPLALRMERRRLWEERRDGALRLAEAGVPFAFGSAGEKPGELLVRVRVLVEAGLDEAVALRALTSGAAELVGAEERVGAIEAGREAHFALWPESPWAEGATPRLVVVDGEVFEHDDVEDATGDGPAATVDATGTWTLRFERNPRSSATLELAMAEDGTVSGTGTYASPEQQDDLVVALSGAVEGDRLTLSATTEMQGFEVRIGLEATIEDDAMRGTTKWKSESGTERDAFTAEREPEGGVR